MRALFLIPLLAACSTPEAVTTPMHGEAPSLELIADQTSTRRETLALAEHAYTGAIIAARQAVATTTGDGLMYLGGAEDRATDALAYLRTLGEADEASFTYALYFYNVAIADLNRVTEGGEIEVIEHAHH